MSNRLLQALSSIGRLLQLLLPIGWMTECRLVAQVQNITPLIRANYKQVCRQRRQERWLSGEEASSFWGRGIVTWLNTHGTGELEGGVHEENRLILISFLLVSDLQSEVRNRFCVRIKFFVQRILKEACCVLSTHENDAHVHCPNLNTGKILSKLLFNQFRSFFSGKKIKMGNTNPHRQLGCLTLFIRMWEQIWNGRKQIILPIFSSFERK